MITFSVFGTAKPSASDEAAWKEIVKREFGKTHLPDITERSLFSIGIHFVFDKSHFIQPGGVKGPDLDNLAKPILDAIFETLRNSGEAIDDERVVRLYLEKSLAELGEPERAEVSVEVVGEH